MGMTDSAEITLPAGQGMAYTGMINGRIIAIGGVAVQRKGTGSGWVLTSDLIIKYKIWTHKVIKNIIQTSFEVYNLHRVEGLILEGHEISAKWAERLGFEREGLLRKYDSAQNNYWLYSLI